MNICLPELIQEILTHCNDHCLHLRYVSHTFDEYILRNHKLSFDDKRTLGFLRRKFYRLAEILLQRQIITIPSHLLIGFIPDSQTFRLLLKYNKDGQDIILKHIRYSSCIMLLWPVIQTSRSYCRDEKVLASYYEAMAIAVEYNLTTWL